MSFDVVKIFDWLAAHIFDALKQIGAAAIIIAVSTFISQWISKNHEAKIAHKYDEQMERFKTDLANVKYVQQHQFDNEYAIYQELCSKFYEMNTSVHWLFPSGLDRAPAVYHDIEGLRKICNERYRMAQKSYNDAIRILGSKAPFINEELYRKFEDIIRLCAQQINYYSFANPIIKESQGVNSLREKGYTTTSIIDEKWDALVAELRTFFNNMNKER